MRKFILQVVGVALAVLAVFPLVPLLRLQPWLSLKGSMILLVLAIIPALLLWCAYRLIFVQSKSDIKEFAKVVGVLVFFAIFTCLDPIINETVNDQSMQFFINEGWSELMAMFLSTCGAFIIVITPFLWGWASCKFIMNYFKDVFAMPVTEPVTGQDAAKKK